MTEFWDSIFDGLHWQMVQMGVKRADVDGAEEFYMFLLIASLCLSAFPMLCYFTVAGSMHSTLWLGMEPRYVCLVAPAALMAVVLAMPLLRCAHFSNRSARLLALLCFLTAGASMVTTSVHLETVALGVSESLIYHCGEPGTISQRMEEEWRRLDGFRTACAGALGKGQALEACPGLAEMLAAPHGVYAGYLQAVELDFRCSGFCHFWASPLFNVELVEAGRRCASSLGSEVARSGHLVSLSVGGVGVVWALLGVSLALYDNL